MEVIHDQIRTGTSTADLKQAILDNLYYVQGRVPELATPIDWYMAVAYTVRDRAMNDWIKSFSLMRHEDIKIVGYLSAEFLIGPQLGNNLLNLGIHDQVQQAVSELGLDLDTLLRQEPEPGLGNGGLGRLAACYMDSLATLRIPAIGYGIRYEFGLFNQEIRDGWQVEKTDKWLRFGNPWEICRPEIFYRVGEAVTPSNTTMSRETFAFAGYPPHVVKGVAYDTLVAGYGGGMVDFLRLWGSEAVEDLRFAGLQCWRLLQGGRGEGLFRDDQQSSLSQ